MGTTLDYSPASWHIVANGANIDAEHRVTREKFSGTVDAFNAMVKAKGYPGIDAIDSIIENPRRVPVTALLSDGVIAVQDGSETRGRPDRGSNPVDAAPATGRTTGDPSTVRPAGGAGRAPARALAGLSPARTGPGAPPGRCPGPPPWPAAP